MVDWQWIIYGLAIIFLIFLFCLYRNNFYLWRYLVKSCKFFEIVEKKLNIIFFIIVFIFLVIVLMFIIYKVSSIPEESIKKSTEIIKVIKNVSRETITYVTKNIFKINTKSLVNNPVIKYLIVPTIILCLYVLVFWLFNRDWTSKEIKITLKIFLGIIVLILLIFCGIKILDWFQRFNDASLPLVDKHLVVKYLIVPTIILCLYVLVFWLFNRDWTSKVTLKIFLEIIVLILLIFCGISTLNWFQKFNIILVILFIQFCFMICTLYCLRIIILFTLKSIFKTISVLVVFMFLFIFLIGILILNHNNKNTIGIRVTKGSLKSLKNGKIELFFKEGKKKFDIRGEGNKLWIKNDMEFENNKIQKILFNKGNEGILFMEEENKNVEFVYINNENTIIKDKQNDEVDISIEGKIIIVKEPEVDKNNIKNYIFIGNNLIWQYLNKIEEIGIEEDNFDYNLLNLFFFFLGIIYFWLKLYGKKSKEYYNYIAIFKIQETKILLDRNKYDKFLTLSMFGLTIPNIWKIATTKSIREMNSSIWTKIDIIYIILFSILLFCLITSKEISEYVKELEKENDKK